MSRTDPVVAVTTQLGWLPDIVLAACVLTMGVVEATALSVDGSGRGTYPAAVGFAAAVGLSRRLPGAALGLIWLIGGAQLLTGTPILLTQLAVAVVAFGAARWGSTATVWLSGLSIPAAPLLLLAFATSDLSGFYVDIARLQSLFELVYRFGNTWVVGAAVIGTAVLGAPWLIGLALRFRVRAQRSEQSQAEAEAEAAQAHRGAAQTAVIAGLREEQAQLARDVHDVVGHSLAVILAQAESGQFLPDDPATLKVTLSTIAGSARTSLQDIGQVLSATRQPTTPLPGALDALVARARESDRDIVSEVLGHPQPLPPELEIVALRVMQEMLTNALRHGRRDRPILVQRRWPDAGRGDELRIEVRNQLPEPSPAPGLSETPETEQTLPITGTSGRGHGVEGMERRLAAVGGQLSVRRFAPGLGPGAAASPTFVATAWVPLRTRRP